MNKVIISDTTTLIVLQKQNQLAILCHIFKQIIIPNAVYDEFMIGIQKNAFNLPSCFKTASVASSAHLDLLLQLLDKGEAEAIELARIKALPLIIDEKKGRKTASQMGIAITGFSGILILACRLKVISSNEAITILEKAIENGYRLSNSLHSQVIKTILNS